MKKFNSVYEFVKFITKPNSFCSNDCYFIKQITVKSESFTGILNNLRYVETISNLKEEYINELFEISSVVYSLSSYKGYLCLNPI